MIIECHLTFHQYQLTTNFWPKYQLTIIFWANCQVTVNPISTLLTAHYLMIILEIFSYSLRYSWRL